MTEKSGIIQVLGEEGLLLPTQLNAALAANDRIKYYFTLLQTALERADHPERQLPTLRTERETAGIPEPSLDTVVTSARRAGPDTYTLPFLAGIVLAIRTCIEEMEVPLRVGQEYPRFSKRKDELFSRIPDGKDGLLDMRVIRDITSGDRDAGDSVHLLVMDMHKALNVLQMHLSGESVDGAKTYLLEAADIPFIRAFMEGLNRTACLKFDHPGLGTTATRSGKKILIQNDIGVTDAHVLVITIKNRQVTITYTDIHMQRIQFFQSLFDTWNVTWLDTLSRHSGDRFEKKVFHLSTGSYAAADERDLLSFLTYAGSRIVFLIDWNRARKQLRNFLLNKDVTQVLKWAADNDIGHMGFLRLGGERTIYAALEISAKVPIRYGEPLHQLIGRERSVEFVKWVLKTASTGLLQNQSRDLIEDEIKAELIRNFRSAHEGLLEICIEHASLIIEVSTVVRDAFLEIPREGTVDFIFRSAKRAKDWESKADQLVRQIRDLTKRIEEAEFFFDLIMTADDVIDYLEDASFFTTLLPSMKLPDPIRAHLGTMADIAARSCQEYLKMLVAAQAVRRQAGQAEMQELLLAVNRVIGLERECDEALRDTQKIILADAGDPKQMWVCMELARLIEESTNSLMKSVYRMHDHMLETMGR